jgi:hypothetical protein
LFICINCYARATEKRLLSTRESFSNNESTDSLSKLRFDQQYVESEHLNLKSIEIHKKYLVNSSLLIHFEKAYKKNYIKIFNQITEEFDD